MSTYFTFNFHLDADMPISDCIRLVDKICNSYSVLLGKSSTLFLGDPEMELDLEPEPVKHIENAINRLASWDYLGGIDYRFNKKTLDVSFRKNRDDQIVKCVSIYFNIDILNSEETREKIKSLVVDLHINLKTMRTIGGIELDDQLDYDEWTEEIKRLSQKEVIGLYWIDILRDNFVSEDRLEYWRQNLEKSGELHRVDGNIYFCQS